MVYRLLLVVLRVAVFLRVEVRRLRLVLAEQPYQVEPRRRQRLYEPLLVPLPPPVFQVPARRLPDQAKVQLPSFPVVVRHVVRPVASVVLALVVVVLAAVQPAFVPVPVLWAVWRLLVLRKVALQLLRPHE